MFFMSNYSRLRMAREQRQPWQQVMEPCVRFFKKDLARFFAIELWSCSEA
jgi:hypothetical protein